MLVDFEHLRYNEGDSSMFTKKNLTSISTGLLMLTATLVFVLLAPASFFHILNSNKPVRSSQIINTYEVSPPITYEEMTKKQQSINAHRRLFPPHLQIEDIDSLVQMKFRKLEERLSKLESKFK